MNRIILIGNGFDLAHELKTSYKDFIDDYWKDKIRAFNDRNYQKSMSNQIEYEDNEIKIINPKKVEDNLPINNDIQYEKFIDSLIWYKARIEYKNKFLEFITNVSHFPLTD
jgi:hypothetical protein